MIKSKSHKVEEVRLPNGAKGLLIHVPGATVMSFEFSFRAGYFLTEKDKWDTPHVMEHLSLGANERYPKARQFEAALKQNGAYANAHTSTYDVWYDAECADFEWDRILDLLLLSISRPKFLASEFEAEKGNVRDELTGNTNNFSRTLGVAMYESFGMLAVADKERIKLLENIKLNDVVEHYKKTHTSSNMRFIIAGNLNGRKTQIIQTISKIKLPKGRGRFELPDETPTGLKRSILINKADVENVFFDFSTFQKKVVNDQESAVARIINIMLTETLNSKILGEAREKGLVYSMGSGFSQYKDFLDWGVGGQAQSRNLPALCDIVVREVGNIIKGKVSDEDIETARQYGLGRFQLGAQTVYGILGGYRNDYFLHDKITDYFGFPERLKKVRKNDVIKIMRGMFKENIWGLGLLGTIDQATRTEVENKLAKLWQIK